MFTRYWTGIPDVGTWKALSRYTKEDDNHNIIKGEVTLLNSHNNIAYGNGKKIIFLNVDDMFCIDSDSVIVLGRKEDIDEVYRLK